MKCLRECYLRRDESTVRVQALADISDMQAQFERVCTDFEIGRTNIKEEFCLFSSGRIKKFAEELDKRYELMRRKLEEHL